MANLILYREGAYNVYSDVDKTACYERSLNVDQLREALFMVFLDEEMLTWQDHLARAHNTGCSADVPAMSLERAVAGNRAGKKGTTLSLEEFCSRYLALHR